MSVAENIFLGNWPQKPGTRAIDYATLKKNAKVLLDRVSLDIDPFTELSKLSVAQKQLVEIAKALSGNCKVLVLDEPTSSLNETETQNLFKIIKALAAEGKGIIYISHRMDEIFYIADKVEVMRDGRLVGVKAMEDTNRAEIVHMMVGREIVDMYPKNEVQIGETVLEVKHLTNKALTCSLYSCNGIIISIPFISIII
jgi:ABC-type sugar transport system ATPase subunit